MKTSSQSLFAFSAMLELELDDIDPVVAACLDTVHSLPRSDREERLNECRLLSFLKPIHVTHTTHEQHAHDSVCNSPPSPTQAWFSATERWDQLSLTPFFRSSETMMCLAEHKEAGACMGKASKAFRLEHGVKRVDVKTRDT